MAITFDGAGVTARAFAAALEAELGAVAVLPPRGDRHLAGDRCTRLSSQKTWGWTASRTRSPSVS